MRDNAVMISSTMPSAKYPCSGSPLRFSNGNTAMDGLSGKAGAIVGDGFAEGSIRCEYLRLALCDNGPDEPITPPPGTSLRARRSAAICTVRLLSSTAKPDHAASISVSLETSAPPAQSGRAEAPPPACLSAAVQNRGTGFRRPHPDGKAQKHESSPFPHLTADSRRIADTTLSGSRTNRTTFK